MAIKDKYVFSSFIRGVDEQSDAFQLNAPTQNQDGKSVGFDLDLVRADNMIFSSFGKIENKKFDIPLEAGVHRRASRLETDGVGGQLFRVDQNDLYRFDNGIFNLIGRAVPYTTQSYFVSSRADNISFIRCDEEYYSAIAKDGKIKIVEMDLGFNKIRVGDVQDDIPLFNPYLICLTSGEIETVFLLATSDDTIFIYNNISNRRPIFSRNTVVDGGFIAVKAHEGNIFYITPRGLYRSTWSPPLRNELIVPLTTFTEHFDFYFDEESGVYHFYLCTTDSARVRYVRWPGEGGSATVNNATVNFTGELVNFKPAGGFLDSATEYTDILVKNATDFIVKQPLGTEIREGDKWEIIYNFFPYYILPEDRYVIYSENGFFITDFDKNCLGRFGGTAVPLFRGDNSFFQKGIRHDPNLEIIPTIQSDDLSSQRIDDRTNQVVTVNAGLKTENSLVLTEVLFPDVTGDDIIETKNSNIVSGSVLSMYDGELMTELNFNQKPEIRLISADFRGAGGQLFRYYAIYSWTDGRGNVHRSGLSNNGNSILLQVNIPKFGMDDVRPAFATFQINYLTLTNKPNVRIEVYRTEANRTDGFYKIATVDNNPNSDTFQIRDDLNARVTGNELLYAFGSIRDNTQPEGARFLDIYNGRVYASRVIDNERKINISKPVNESAIDALEFDGLGTIFVPDPITGTEVMDDKLIIFTENRVYFYREGFVEPEPVTGAANIGCSDLGATVIDTDGIYFKSDKGVYLLTRGLELQFVGYPMDVSLSQRVIECVNSTKDRELYFLVESGDIVVYNTFFKNFTVHNSKPVKSMVMSDKNLHVLTNNDRIFVQKDDVTPVGDERFVVETGWIQLSSLINYMRVKEMYLLGVLDDIEQLEMSLAYDYDDHVFFRKRLTKEDINRSKIFQGVSIFEGDNIFGLNRNQNTYRFFPTVQKCNSIMLRLNILSRRNFFLSGIGFRYASKKGLTRQRTF